MKTFISYNVLLRHIKFSHAHLSKYNCGQKNCHRSFQDISGLRKHYQHDSSHHLFLNMTLDPRLVHTPNITEAHDIADNSSSSDTTEFPANNNNVGNVDNTSKNDNLNIRSLVIDYIAKLYENPLLPRNLVQNVIDNTRELVEGIFNSLIKTHNTPEFQKTLHLLLSNVEETFDNFKTEHLRLAHFKKTETFLPPKSFYIGSTRALQQIDTAGAPVVNVKRVEGQQVKLAIKLKKFLELPQVYDNIFSYIEKETSSQETITSIYQGSLWNSIKTSFAGQMVFPIFLFFDDFEPCNALGSRAGLYKIGAVYISLACIPPEFSSSLENIFLAQLFFSSDRETFGNRQVFSKLIEELLFLEKEGITICTTKGPQQVFFHSHFNFRR